MNDKLNEKISQFIDDELAYDDALRLLQNMQSHAELINTMNRYQTISHALKTEQTFTVSADFTAKISQQIQQEPHYLLPQQRSTRPRNYKIMALAAAASVAVVAVLVGRNVNQSPTPFDAEPALQVAQQPTPSSPVVKSVVYVNQNNQQPLNSRINDYLQAHNASVYTNGEASFKSLTQVTAYGQK